MPTFKEGLASAVKTAICTTLGRYDDALRYIGNIPLIGSAAGFANVAGPLRAQLCDKPPDDLDIPDPPFTGGQCCGAAYEATYCFLNPNTGMQQCGQFQWNDAQLVGLDVRSNQPAQPTKSGGPLLKSCSTGAVQFIPLGTTFEADDIDQSITNIVRTDGGADDCGDINPPPPPVQPIDVDIDVTYNDGDTNVEINIDGSVRIGPAFSTGDFNLRVPVRIQLGDANFNGYVDLSPEFNLVIAPRINFGNGGAVDDPTELPIVDPVDTTPPPEYEDQAAIVGVFVTAIQDSPNAASSILTQGMPTIKAPRVGSVSFAIERSFTVAWTPDIDVKSLDCYIPCPEPRGAVGVSVTPVPGVRLGWTPVRGFPLT